MVLRDQNLRGAVSESGECGHVRVFFMLVNVMFVFGVADFPDADFVVLVGAEEFVGLNNQGLNGAVSGENGVLRVGAERGAVPGPDFPVGGARVKEFAGEG